MTKYFKWLLGSLLVSILASTFIILKYVPFNAVSISTFVFTLGTLTLISYYAFLKYRKIKENLVKYTNMYKMHFTKTIYGDNPKNAIKTMDLPFSTLVPGVGIKINSLVETIESVTIDSESMVMLVSLTPSYPNNDEFKDLVTKYKSNNWKITDG